ncbi:hypothetical protein [Streptomyces sp. 900105755]
MVWKMWDAETSFVGRAAELGRIAAEMGGNRLVTLSGAGGVGKTRLAQRTVALGRAAGTGTDVAWADLSPLRNAHLPAATVVDAQPAAPARGPAHHHRLEHELCTPQERLLWARLSYLPGSFDDELAGQLAGGGALSPGGVGWTLVSLCEKSVVVRKDGAYRMLDAVREYGRMWLAELGAERELAHRHAQYVLAQTRQAHREWFGPAQRSWYRRIGFLHSYGGPVPEQ